MQLSTCSLNLDRSESETTFHLFIIHLLAVWPQARHITFLKLNAFICQMGIMIVTMKFNVRTQPWLVMFVDFSSLVYFNALLSDKDLLLQKSSIKG